MTPAHALQDGQAAALEAAVVDADVATLPDCFPVAPFGPSPAFVAWLGTLPPPPPPTPRARARHAAEMAQRARERDVAHRATSNAAARTRRAVVAP